MWSASNSAADAAPLHRPKPRRPFDLEPLTPSTSSGGSPAPSSSKPANDLPSWIDQQETLSPTSPTGISTPGSSIGVADFSKRTKSVLNLTASTLFGIYSHTYNNEGSTEPPTPFTLSRTNSVVNVSDTTGGSSATDRINGIIGSGNNNLIAVANGKLSPLSQLQPESDEALSKSRNGSSSPTSLRRRRHGKRTPTVRLIVRHSALLAFGVIYGIIVMHLHNTKKFTPESWERIVDYNPVFLLVWGFAGVVLGSLLPWIDFYLGEGQDGGDDGRGSVADWMQVVRSIGAFVGVAYGIRKLPWQSTLQISLTLSLLNPFLWYAVDRTRAGFWLAAFVGTVGTAVLVQINPDLILAPETLAANGKIDDTGALLLGGLVSEKTIAASAWMCSVLFCSCVCFGNIGRRLAFRERDL
ncbi:INSIG domain-containing protein [Peziza echinospora]|nr:INSIG domain-containing protein [Peziza echinospora]